MSISSSPLLAFMQPAPVAPPPSVRRADAWFIADSDGRCLAASPSWAEAAGLRATDAVVGKRWERAVDAGERDALAEQVSLQCNFGDGFQGECRLQRPDGRPTRALLSVVPIAVPGHKDAAFLGLIVDCGPGLTVPAAGVEVEAWAQPALEEARERLLGLRRPA